MPPTPDHVVLVNTACAPDCHACPGGLPPAQAPPSTSGLVYLGREALDGSPAVADALRAVPEDTTAVAITHGAGRTSLAELESRLDRLRRIRPVRVVYALDVEHYRAAGIDRVRAM